MTTDGEGQWKALWWDIFNNFKQDEPVLVSEYQQH